MGIVVKIDGELADLGMSKFDREQKKLGAAKAAVRICYSEKKEYLKNLAENLKSTPEGIASVDLQKQPLRLAEISSFLPSDGKGAAFHLDVRNGGANQIVGLICKVPFVHEVQGFVKVMPNPLAPKQEAAAGAIQPQKTTGFPKFLPRFLGFMNFPGQLNFPVIDLERDAPDIAKQQRES